MSDAPAAPVTEIGVPPVMQEKVEETPGFKVFAGNLAYSTTDEGLRTFFAPVESDILSAQVILRGTRSAGYGFVALSTAEAAQKAVETLDKQELDGRQVIVEVAKPSDQKDKEKKEKKAKRRPGRRGSKAVPGEISEAEANGEPAKVDSTPAEPGSDEAAKPKKKKKKAPRKPKVKAEGEASDGGPLDTEVGASEDPTANKKTRVRKPRAPRPPRPAGEDPVGEPSKTMLFVANLGFSVDDDGLAALFTNAGIAVTSARIVRRRWGQPRKSKGYGFVDVGGEEEQKKAIAALEGKDVGGRTIAVKIAVNAPHDDDAEESREGAAPNDTTAADAPLKSRRQREIEAREEGLSKSLFERAKEEEDAGISPGNKALSMMMKMGFKPGQSLGKIDEDISNISSLPEPGININTEEMEEKNTVVKNLKSHKIEPLPLNEWAGKQGIGLGKRARSPTLSERVAKMAKMAEETNQRDYRDRARQEYEERRAESKLGPAQRTCVTLDDASGKPFNVLWLNPNNTDTFPAGLTDALAKHGHLRLFHDKPGETVQARLRRQMQEDALEALDGLQRLPVTTPETFSPEQIEEVVQFLRLQAQDRLHLVLSYLRDSYTYCFWCGVQYENEEMMEGQCPGPDEESHD
ncbi:hypothetical protein BDZ94DRAFT_1286943 [Collybia nuda]|uniref:RRM domain-containing protein n=1 Tax=Collybia nuda TaxID=64659 RepID=A0A9P5YI48_9AGAR|nr:hypothetical protein BDZ94DRAFT_1286943 [Collybia nuda]